MVNIQLTTEEWYLLASHIKEELEKHPNNKYLNRLSYKFAKNKPQPFSNQFKMEYDSIWIDGETDNFGETFKDIEVNEEVLQAILLKFKLPLNILRYVYDEVIELLKTYDNVYVCMKIVENEILHKQHKSNEIVRNYMRQSIFGDENER